MNTVKPVINKVPGTLFLSKNTNNSTNTNVKDLSKLEKVELEELLDRQIKLLEYKSRLNRLPDKGKRIQDLHDKILEELEKRNVIDQAAEMFSQLNIVQKGKQAITSIEWNGKYTDGDEEEQLDLDSDDEEDEDPLKIIAQNQLDKRKIKILKPETKLITETDLIEVESFKSDTVELELKLKDKSKLKSHIKDISSSSTPEPEIFDQHVNYVCSKEINETIREKFKPYFTTKSNVHDPEKEKLQHKKNNWENTSATPPPLQNSKAQILTLHDSIELQMEQNKKYKEILEKQAVERLVTREKSIQAKLDGLKIIDKPLTTELFQKFRSKISDDEDDDNESTDNEEHEEFTSDIEVHDECDEDKGGVSVVVYE